MQDEQIVELYWQREERAIVETDKKYGPYCYTIADNILQNREDAEECVSDTWFRTWNAIPPQRPSKLQMYLAKIARHLAFDRFKARAAEKRGGGEIHLVLSELEECIPAPGGVEETFLAKELAVSIDRFVRNLPLRERNVFVRRYFYTEPITRIAEKYGLTHSNTSVILSRVRQKLKVHLAKEGYTL